ncbi:nucleolar protein 9 [Caerostris extrusa]|uniref:Nucleolar protein 9 n=1 Tax=Caerostris extrusa TaxID=172846 RepID=A0AAV4XEC5_CAEEX|nr:nucleolar protein 9 [Caerostris extrusa]
MEEQALFFEDRKGNINSKKRKRDKRNQNANNLNFDVGKAFSPKDKILQDQLSDNPPTKRQAIFNNNSPHSYHGRKVVENSRYYKEDYKGSQNREYNRGTERDSYSRKNNYQEQNYNDSEKKEKDKKLIELVSYYEKILQTLNGGLTNEDSDIFVSNVLQESEGYEVKLSCHRFSSHCIELLLSVSQDPAISQQFMTAFVKEKEEVVTNANASHITELLLNIAIQNIKNWSSIMEADEDNPEKEHVSYFISWISDLAEFIIENFDCCLQNQYTCHVVCTAIRALGGDMSATTDFMSKKSVEHKKNFREQYSNEETFKAKQPIAPIVLESVPKFFTKLLKKMAKALLNLENIVDYVTDSSSATVIQTLMCILKKRIPKRCRKLISKLATLIFSEKNDNGVPKSLPS